VWRVLLCAGGALLSHMLVSQGIYIAQELWKPVVREHFKAKVRQFKNEGGATAHAHLEALFVESTFGAREAGGYDRGVHNVGGSLNTPSTRGRQVSSFHRRSRARDSHRASYVSVSASARGSAASISQADAIPGARPADRASECSCAQEPTVATIHEGSAENAEPSSLELQIAETPSKP